MGAWQQVPRVVDDDRAEHAPIRVALGRSRSYAGRKQILHALPARNENQPIGIKQLNRARVVVVVGYF